MNERMRFEGLTLTVDSVERSIDFFSRKLGLKVEWKRPPRLRHDSEAAARSVFSP